MESLARRGHELTIVTSHPVDYSSENFTMEQIDINEAHHNWSKLINMAQLRENDGDEFKPVKKELIETYMTVMEDIMASKQIQSLIRDHSRRFDLCFIAALASHAYPFKDRFNCNLILISSQGGYPSQFEAFGSPSNPIAYPMLFSPYSENLNFFQRVHVSFIYFGQNLYNRFYYVPLIEESIKRHFGNGYRSISDIERSADMLFLSENPLLGVNRPVTNSVLYLYGLHIQPNKELPEVRNFRFNNCACLFFDA